MAHSLWKGHVTFGLVNIPVQLYSAESPRELHFKLLDKRNQGKVKYQRINEETGKEVPWDQIVKGYEYEKGNYVILSKQDFESVAQENLKTIEIEEFVPQKKVEIFYFETPYYLVPDKGGEKGYVLLRETLKATGKIGIARLMIHSRQHIAAIMPQGNALFINTLRYQHELKSENELSIPTQNSKSYKITKKEIEIAEQLINTMSENWDPTRYQDKYHDDLLKLIAKKAKHGDQTTAKSGKEKIIKQTNVVDFMKLLKQSIKEKKHLPPPKKNRKNSK